MEICHDASPVGIQPMATEHQSKVLSLLPVGCTLEDDVQREDANFKVATRGDNVIGCAALIGDNLIASLAVEEDSSEARFGLHPRYYYLYKYSSSMA